MIDELKNVIEGILAVIWVQICNVDEDIVDPINDMDLEDLINQVTALILIEHYLTASEFEKPLNAYINEYYEGSPPEDEVKALQRAYLKLRTGKEKEREEGRRQGHNVPKTPVSTSKRAGNPISRLNFRAVLNLRRSNTELSPIYRLITTHNIASVKKLSHTDFVACFEEYDRWFENSKKDLDRLDEETLCTLMDAFLLQEKTHLDLWIQVATYMDVHKIENFPLERSALFWNTLRVPSSILQVNQVKYVEQAIPDVFHKGERFLLERSTQVWSAIIAPGILEANQVRYFEQAIPTVFNKDEQSYERAAIKWVGLRMIQASLLSQLRKEGVHQYLSRVWNTEEVATYFLEYHDVINMHKKSEFRVGEKLNKVRINNFRKIADEVFKRWC